MHNLFLSLYKYFEERKFIFALVILGIIGLCIYSITYLRLEEDISKIMPTDEGMNLANDIFDQSDIADRLAVLVSVDSTKESGSPEELISYCLAFVNALTSTSDSAYIREVNYRIDESGFIALYDHLYKHLPLFLEPEDYQYISQITHEDSIASFANGIYKSLLTPGGSFYKKFVFRDPFGYTNLAMKHLQRFELDENIQLHDGYLITKDLRHLLIIIQPKESGKETRQNARLIEHLDEVIARTNSSFPGIHATYFGGAAVAVGNAKQVRKDVTYTVAFALIALFLLITYFFRRVSVFLFLIIPTALGGLLALSCMSLFDSQTSIIAIGIGSVLMGITLDYSLHIFTHYRKTRNVNSVFKDLFSPIGVSSVTTATAFLSLFFIRSEALRDLGAFAALSVMLTALTAFIVLPHLLSTVNYKKSVKKNWLEKLAAFKLKSTTPALILVASATVVAIIFAPGVKFEDDLSKVNFMSDELEQAEQKLNRVTNATQKGLYIVSTGTSMDEAMSNSRSLLHPLDSFFASGDISGYNSISTIIPDSATQAERIERWKDFWTVDKQRTLTSALNDETENLGFKKGMFNPFIELLDEQFIIQPTENLLSAFKPLFSEFIFEKEERTGILTIVRVTEQEQGKLYTTIEQLKNTTILDKSYIIKRFVEILKEDFDRLVFWSFIFIFFLLHLAFGRTELALISLTPIILSWIWTLGLMNIFDIKFNIVNIIITTFIFGLGIDYGIFVMRGLMQKNKTGVNHIHSYKTSILLSAITTLIGIGVMITARHPALRSIASVSIIGISSVVLLTFLLQPVLYNWLIKSSDGSIRKRPITNRTILKTAVNYILLATSGILLCLTFLFLAPIRIFSKRSYSKLCRNVTHFFCLSFLRIMFIRNFSIQPGLQYMLNKNAIASCSINNYYDYIILSSLGPDIILIGQDQQKHPTSTGNLIYKFLRFTGNIVDSQTYSGKIKTARNSDKFVSIYQESDNTQYQPITSNNKKIDITGSDRLFTRESFWVHSSDIHVALTKSISDNVRNSISRTLYHRYRLYENYIYKDNVLWYYMVVKVPMENYYKVFDDLIPDEATISDLGCGYGFMCYMLHFCSDQRQITGVDYDIDKIETAQYCNEKNERINFICSDLREVELLESDVFILADVLHYLQEEDQFNLLNRILRRLNPGGMVILRDGDSDKSSRHKATKWTEKLSTGLGFNTAKNNLQFTSSSRLKEWAEKHHLDMECIEESRRTSNSIFIFRKKE